MTPLSLRITDHRTGFDQTIEVTSAASGLPLQLSELVVGTIETAAAQPRFVDNGDGTITDTVNRLMWSKATNTSKCVDHKTAEGTCAALDLAGHTDWRLPTRTELLTLVDDTRHQPAIDTDAFPDTKSDWYWTSTITAWASSCAWVVDFSYGSAFNGHRDSDDAFVRAVRSLPAGQ